MSKFKSLFYRQLELELKNPEFEATYFQDQIRVRIIDDLINELDQARLIEGLSKAKLARYVGAEPANVRRFFTKSKSNPTMASVLDLAMALGLTIQLVPLPQEERALLNRVSQRQFGEGSQKNTQSLGS